MISRLRLSIKVHGILNKDGDNLIVAALTVLFLSSFLSVYRSVCLSVSLSASPSLPVSLPSSLLPLHTLIDPHGPRVLHGERPYWWVFQPGLYPDGNIPHLRQFSITCETGPGQSISVQTNRSTQTLALVTFSIPKPIMNFCHCLLICEC